MPILTKPPLSNWIGGGYYLYNLGNEFPYITGGWYFNEISKGQTYGTLEVDKTSISMNIKITTTSSYIGATVKTNLQQTNVIDFTKFKTFNMEGTFNVSSGIGNDKLNVYLTETLVSNNQAPWGIKNKQIYHVPSLNKNGIISIPISSITGLWYPDIVLDGNNYSGTNEIIINKIWLE